MPFFVRTTLKIKDTLLIRESKGTAKLPMEFLVNSTL